MNQNMIDFINDHEEMINNEEWFDLFHSAWHTFSHENVRTLMEIIFEIADEKSVSTAAMVAYFKWRIEFELETNIWGDMANSWSRLRWKIDGYPIYQYELNFQEIFNALSKNKEWVGVTLKPLDIEYSWDGSQDYDLGWFRPQYYSEDGN